MTPKEEDDIFGPLRAIAIRLQRKLKLDDIICDDVEVAHPPSEFPSYRVTLRDTSGRAVKKVTLDGNENILALVPLTEREKPEMLMELIRAHHPSHMNFIPWVRELMRLITVEALPDDIILKTEFARRVCKTLGLN